MESTQDVIGQRVWQAGKFGSIRFLGKLTGNAKAGDDLWLGIEWDDPTAGKHNGTVDGVKYFEPLFQNSQTSCSFIRNGKIKIGGVTFEQAILQKYKPDSMMSDEELKAIKQREEANLYVNTDKRGGMKKIEILGVEQSYSWRADVTNSRDISLENMKISNLGDQGVLRKLIPGTFNLYLDKNLLYSWDQYFSIIKQLDFLRIVTLTGNKFNKIGADYLNDKNINQLIHTSVFELVLIDMALDWQQIDILAPVLCYIEHLHLVRNQCSQIFSKFKLPKDHFKLLKFINLEENGIASWEEIEEFRKLPNLKRMTLNKNPISKVQYKQGWPELYMLSMEDCNISEWYSFDQFNEFPKITNLRITGNPITGQDRASETIVARMQFLNTLNGARFSDAERRDCELYYMKQAYKDFLLITKQVSVQSLEDPALADFMLQNHARFYTLVEKFGNPLDLTSNQKESTNISNTSAKVDLISEVTQTLGKTLSKKLLTNMTVAQLKAICSKFFQVDILRIEMVYKEPGFEDEYVFDFDERQLSFFSVKDGGQIIVREIPDFVKVDRKK